MPAGQVRPEHDETGATDEDLQGVGQEAGRDGGPQGAQGVHRQARGKRGLQG